MGRWSHVEVTFVEREENDKWLRRADALQRELSFPTSLPACSFVRIWADGILPDVDAVIAMDTNDEVVLGDIADLCAPPPQAVCVSLLCLPLRLYTVYSLSVPTSARCHLLPQAVHGTAALTLLAGVTASGAAGGRSSRSSRTSS